MAILSSHVPEEEDPWIAENDREKKKESPKSVVHTLPPLLPKNCVPPTEEDSGPVRVIRVHQPNEMRGTSS